jgi:hypothetical protein
MLMPIDAKRVDAREIVGWHAKSEWVRVKFGKN